MSKFNYGASFNCNVDDGAIGGGEEGDVSIDYVGNDLEKMIAVICNDDKQYPLHVARDHELLGKKVDLGGEVVAVLVDLNEDTIAVIFEDPHGPTVIE